MENIDIDIDIDKDNLKNIDIDIDIDMAILENIDIDIDIDKEILQNIDIDKISYRFGFGISNTPTAMGPSLKWSSTYRRKGVSFGILCCSEKFEEEKTTKIKLAVFHYKNGVCAFRDVGCLVLCFLYVA